jgi:hypothetical protein
MWQNGQKMQDQRQNESQAAIMRQSCAHATVLKSWRSLTRAAAALHDKNLQSLSTPPMACHDGLMCKRR